ncbi:MAG: hypothetical protein IKL43_08470 [Alistipes sp.]|nr:hypothetical protein [Alistipes sp.]
MTDFESKYSGEQVENLLDQVANGEAGGGGGITTESDPVFSASPAASITEEDKQTWSGKQEAISDLKTIRSNASKGATAVQPESLASVATSGSYDDLSDKPTIPAAVTESTVSEWGFTKNAGTVTGVKINGETKSPANGIVDLGTIEGGEGGSGLPYYIVQSFNIDTILAAGTNNGIIEIDEQDGEEIYRAVADGKVILIPKDPEHLLMGYTIASGYAEDLAYLTFMSDNYHITLEGRSSSMAFLINELPKSTPDGSTIGGMYKSDILNVDLFLDVLDSGGQSQEQLGDEFLRIVYALEAGFQVVIRDPDGSYLPIFASTDNETIWYSFIYRGEIYSGEVMTTELNITKHNIVYASELLDSTSIQLTPGVLGIVYMDEYAQSSYSISFANELSASEISNGKTHEYKIQMNISLGGETVTISFPENVVWANDNTPVFEDGKVYQCSFMPYAHGTGAVRYLGVWSVWSHGINAEPV